MDAARVTPIRAYARHARLGIRGTIADHLREWLEDLRCMRAHRASLREPDDDLAGLMREMDLTRSHLAALEISPFDSLALLEHMMSSLGVAVDRLHGGELAALERACVGCRRWRRCRRWLDGAGEAADYRAFCGNAPALERALAERHA